MFILQLLEIYQGCNAFNHLLQFSYRRRPAMAVVAKDLRSITFSPSELKTLERHPFMDNCGNIAPFPAFNSPTPLAFP